MKEKADLRGYKFSEHLDREFLAKNYGSNLTLAVKIFNLFLKSAEKELAALKEAINKNDYNDIYQISHKNKNNFLFVGLPKLSKLFTSLEKFADAKSPEVHSTFEMIQELFPYDFKVVEAEMKSINSFLSNLRQLN